MCTEHYYCLLDLTTASFVLLFLKERGKSQQSSDHTPTFHCKHPERRAGGESVIAPWESSSTGAQEWHKNGLCCHKALFARATQGGSVTRHGGMFVFVALDFQNPRACCGWQAPLSLQLLEVCTPAWKTWAQHSKNVHHSCAIRQCLGELQRRGGRRQQRCSNLHYFYFLCKSHFYL